MAAATADFTGPFLFVNHDAGHLRSAPHRHRVFTHVQSNYHRWRRTENAKQLRASAKVPRSPPKAMHYKGNSDPFDSLPVRVDPQVSELLNFERIHLYPATQSIIATTSTSEQFATRWRSFTTSFLHDQMSAYPFLSRICAVMARCSSNPEYGHLAIEYKTRGSQRLRQHLSKPSDDPGYQQKIGLAVVTLLLAETFAENYSAAAIHLKMLESMYERQFSAMPALTDLHNAISVIYQDGQRSSCTLTPPIFPLDGWVKQMFELPDPFVSPDGNEGMDPCIDQSGLKELMATLRTYNMKLRMILVDPTKATTDTWFWITSKSILLMGSCMAEACRAWDAEDYVSTYASLAMVYRMRRVGNMEAVPVGTTSIYNAATVIIPRIQEALEKDDNPKYANLKLWTLHVMVWHSSEFVPAFTAQAKKMEIKSWEQARDILQGFSYSDLFGPHISTWFDPPVKAESPETQAAVAAAVAAAARDRSWGSSRWKQAVESGKDVE